MKLMKVFQIESDYQRHKRKLSLIKSEDTCKKVTAGTRKSMDKINSFNRKKSSSAYFQEYLKDRDVMKKNQHLHKTLTKVYEKDPSKNIIKRFIDVETTSLKRSHSQQSARSHASFALQLENSRMSKKISMARSSYKKFRQKKPSKHVMTEVSHREEVIKILERQLGCKPTVIFPRVSKKEKEEKLKKFQSCSWK